MTTWWNSPPLLPTKWLQMSSENMKLETWIALLDCNDLCFYNVNCLDAPPPLFYYNKNDESISMLEHSICGHMNLTWPWSLRINVSFLFNFILFYHHFTYQFQFPFPPLTSPHPTPHLLLKEASLGESTSLAYSYVARSVLGDPGSGIRTYPWCMKQFFFFFDQSVSFSLT